MISMGGSRAVEETATTILICSAVTVRLVRAGQQGLLGSEDCFPWPNAIRSLCSHRPDVTRKTGEAKRMLKGYGLDGC